MKAVGLVLLGGCVMSPVMHFGAGKNADEAQHDRAKDLTPPILVAVKERGGTITTEHIRVWADDDYRAQNVDWKHTFAEQLEYANAVLGPELNIRLDAEYAQWSYHAQDAPLEQTLDALAEHDHGDGAFAVIGLTSALALVDATIEHIGMARLPGKFVVLRGYANHAEQQAFSRAFPELDEEERVALHEARRHFQGAALLLHELGHNFGAQHEDDPSTLMNPSLSTKAAGFSESAHQTMLATVDGRLGRGHTTAAAAPAAPLGSRLVITVGILGLSRAGLPLDAAGYAAILATVPRDTELVLHFRRGAKRSRLTGLLDQAKAAGLAKISFEAE